MAMIHGSDPEDRQDFADFLSVLAFSLFGVFAVTALASAAPLQLLDPSWKLRLAASLIDNGPIAALGVLAAWRGLSQALTAERQEEREITARITSLRQLVRRAPTLAELQGPWQAQQGPPLSAADLSLPLPQLQAQLLVRLQQLSDRLAVNGRAGAANARVWSVVQNTLRLCLSALLLGLGFAAAGQNRPGNPSLLQHWQWLWFRSLHAFANLRPGRLIQPRRSRSRIGRKGFADSDYFDQITPRD